MLEGRLCQMAVLSIPGLASLIYMFNTWKRGIRIDWDIDTFIVISQKYISGAEFYTDFFDPKWPHIQWLYLPGALSRSLLVHQFASWIAIALTGISLFLISSIKKVGGAVRVDTIAVFSGCLYMTLAQLLPGGNNGQLEIYANLFMSLALLSGVFSFYLQSTFYRVCGFSLTGFLMGFGCGIRPNLIIPVLLVGSFLTILQVIHGKRLFISTVAAIATVIGLAVPFIPYLRTPEAIRLAWSGAFGILGDWNVAMYTPYSLNGLLSDLAILYSPRVYGQAFALLLFPVLLIVVLHWKRRCNWLICTAGSLYAIGLIYSYYLTHIHHHYILLDFFGICSVLAFIERNTTLTHRKVLLLIVLFFASALLLRPVPALSKADANYLYEQEKISAFLADHPSKSFAAPELINLHWIHNEPVKTRGLHQVWSINLATNSLRNTYHARVLGLDKGIKELCSIWTSESVDYVIMSTSLLKTCQATKSYYVVDVPGLDKVGSSFHILERR